MRRYSREIGIASLLVVLSAAVFWRVLAADFVAWDDGKVVYSNPHIQGLNAHSLKWMFTDVGYTFRYQPLTWLSWTLIYECNGLNPFGYHLANLGAHCLNVGLVFLLLRKVLLLRRRQDEAGQPSNSLLLCAGAGAFWWGLHPLRVEVVAWVSAFLHEQALFFLLLSALFYLEAHSPAATSRRKTWGFAASLFSFALSLLSFPIGLGFVPVLVVLDIWLLNRFNAGPGRWWDAAARRVGMEKAPFAAVAVVAVGLNLLMRYTGTGNWPKPPSLAEFGLYERLLQAGYIWAYYSWKPWWPFDLSPFYLRLADVHANDPGLLLSLASVAGVSLLVWWKRTRWPAALAWWTCHLVLLVPVLGWTEKPHFPCDRYSLIVGILWAVVIAAALLRMGQRPARQRFIALAAAGAALGLLVFLTARQVPIWRDSVSLFTYLSRYCDSTIYAARMRYRLGLAYLNRHDRPSAIRSFHEALERKPVFPEAQAQLAKTLYEDGRLDDAITHFNAALRLEPRSPDLHNQLGAALAARGDLEAALQHFTTALELNPTAAYIDWNLGLTLQKLGRADEAKVHLEKGRPAANR